MVLLAGGCDWSRCDDVEGEVAASFWQRVLHVVRGVARETGVVVVQLGSCSFDRGSESFIWQPPGACAPYYG